MLQKYTSDSCIAATRIAIELLGYFGVEACALPVSAAVANRAGTRLLSGDTDVPECERKDAWAVAIGQWPGAQSAPCAGRTKPGWPGHLVAYLPSESLVLDLSLDQASRPEHDINVGPIAFPVPLEFLSGERVRLQSPDRAVGMFYQVDLGNTAYTHSSDWSDDRAMRRDLVGRIIRLCREAAVRTRSASDAKHIA